MAEINITSRPANYEPSGESASYIQKYLGRSEKISGINEWLDSIQKLLKSYNGKKFEANNILDFEGEYWKICKGMTSAYTAAKDGNDSTVEISVKYTPPLLGHIFDYAKSRPKNGNSAGCLEAKISAALHPEIRIPDEAIKHPLVEGLSDYRNIHNLSISYGGLAVHSRNGRCTIAANKPGIDMWVLEQMCEFFLMKPLCLQKAPSRAGVKYLSRLFKLSSWSSKKQERKQSLS